MSEHEHEVLALPEDAQKATVEVRENEIWLVGHDRSLDPTPAIIRTTLRDWTPTTANWATIHLQTSDNGAKIAAAIREGTAVAVSDGSFFPDVCRGAAAVVLEASTSRGRVCNKCITPGHRELQGAYQSE